MNETEQIDPVTGIDHANQYQKVFDTLRSKSSESEIYAAISSLKASLNDADLGRYLTTQILPRLLTENEFGADSPENAATITAHIKHFKNQIIELLKKLTDEYQDNANNPIIKTIDSKKNYKQYTDENRPNRRANESELTRSAKSQISNDDIVGATISTLIGRIEDIKKQLPSALPSLNAYREKNDMRHLVVEKLRGLLENLSQNRTKPAQKRPNQTPAKIEKDHGSLEKVAEAIEYKPMSSSDAMKYFEVDRRTIYNLVEDDPIFKECSRKVGRVIVIDEKKLLEKIMENNPGVTIKPGEKIYTIKNLSEYLDFHERTTYQLVKNNRLKAFRLGTYLIRIPESSVIEFIKFNSTPDADFKIGDKLYDLKTAAQMIGIDRRTLYDQIKLSGIPFISIGRLYRFTQAMIDQIKQLYPLKKPKNIV